MDRPYQIVAFVLVVLLAGLPVAAQTPCYGIPIQSANTPLMPGQQAPQATALDLTQVCARIAEVDKKVTDLQVQLQKQADKQSAFETVFGNRYVQMLLAVAATYATVHFTTK